MARGRGEHHRRGFDRRIRDIARQEVQRPALVNQRTVEALVGLPRERYLELARGGAFPATKVQRLVVARTVDVLGYFERRLQPRGPRIARATGEEAASEPRLVRAGFRRLVRLDHAQARAQERS